MGAHVRERWLTKASTVTPTARGSVAERAEEAGLGRDDPGTTLRIRGGTHVARPRHQREPSGPRSAQGQGGPAGARRGSSEPGGRLCCPPLEGIG